MAQTGYTPLLIYSSSTVSQAPSAGNLTNSTLGSELAINITDGKLFYKDNANAVQVIAWKTTPTTAGGTGLISYTAGDMLYYASGTTLTQLTIGASGRWLGSSGTAPQWNAPAALTKTDDTNVTLTLGGSASTALLNAASLTLGWTGQLAVTRGGTGLSTVAQGDILYGSASNTLAALAKNTTATRYLSNTGTSNNPAWAQVDLTNGVTGTLPVGNGGTGLASFTANGILYASGTTTVATGSALTFDGTNFATTGTVTGTKLIPTGGSTAGNGIYLPAANTLGFTINGSERGRITSNGVLVWEQISASQPIADFSNGQDTPTAIGFTVNFPSGTGTNNTTAILFQARSAGSERLYIYGNGNVVNVNGSYGVLSDEKLKTDIVDANSQWEDIKAIRFRKFKLKKDPNQFVHLGVVAQELEQVSPKLIDESLDRDEQGNVLDTTTKTVKTSVLMMKAAVALQEAIRRIEALEAKVSELS